MVDSVATTLCGGYYYISFYGWRNRVSEKSPVEESGVARTGTQSPCPWAMAANTLGSEVWWGLTDHILPLRPPEHRVVAQLSWETAFLWFVPFSTTYSYWLGNIATPPPTSFLYFSAFETSLHTFITVHQVEGNGSYCVQQNKESPPLPWQQVIVLQSSVEEN